MLPHRQINTLKTPAVGGGKCSRCGRLSGGAGVEGGGEVGAEVEDETDVGAGMMQGEELV
jgi:hypothetical protein